MNIRARPELVLANGAVGPNDGREPIAVHYLPDAEARRIHIALPSFVDSLLHVPARTLDLLEIAAYVFAVDRLLNRGRSDAVEYHSWSRSIDLHVRVRDFDFWNQGAVKAALSEALEFMTGDAAIGFNFESGHNTPPVNLFDKEQIPIPGPKERAIVILFSGGIDSLAGTLESLDASKSKILLVSHQSGAATARTQRKLVDSLKEKYGDRVIHYRFRCTLRDGRAVDETQRTRSFLYTSIAYAIASAWKERRIVDYENGVTSINLNRREDLSNARASRTTHPRTIMLLSKLFGLIDDCDFQIELPYLNLTKRDVVGRLHDKASYLLASTVSCTRTFKSFGQATHCGHCFQCIDRRIATFAAGAREEDHRGLYAEDIVRSAIGDGAARTVALDYVRQARGFADGNLAQFEDEYLSELALLMDCMPDRLGDEEHVQAVWGLLQRHGEAVRAGIGEMRRSQDALAPLVKGSILGLVSAGEHTKPRRERLAEAIEAVVRAAVGEMFSQHRPANEGDLNGKLAAVLGTHEVELESEFPTGSFACARVVADHAIRSAELLIEAKYIRKGTTPSRATEGIAADLTKYPANAFILFVVYDPDHAIPADRRFREDIEAKGRNRVVIVR